MNKHGAIAILAAASGLAHAAPVSYTDRAAFDAATGPQTIEDFESETLGQLAMPAVFDSGLGVRLATGQVSALIEIEELSFYDLHNTTVDGQNYLRFGVQDPTGLSEFGSYTVEFGFAQTVNAFGFDLSGFRPLDALGGFGLSLFLNGQLVEDIFVPSTQAFDGAYFYGFARDAGFDAARVFIPVLNGDGDEANYVAFDGVTWSGVPSPAGVSLLGLAGLAGARRRR